MSRPKNGDRVLCKYNPDYYVVMDDNPEDNLTRCFNLTLSTVEILNTEDLGKIAKPEKYT